MKDKLLDLFEDILERWIIAEEVVINDRGNTEDYKELENQKKEYMLLINDLLSKLIC